MKKRARKAEAGHAGGSQSDIEREEDIYKREREGRRRGGRRGRRMEEVEVEGEGER